MPNLVVPHYPIEDAFKRTWNTRLELMTECSCPCRGPFRKMREATNLGLPPNIFVHVTCGMPSAYNLSFLANECDNCERWYVSNELPDNWFLCSGCR